MPADLPSIELKPLQAHELLALSRLCRQSFWETYSPQTDPLDVQLYMNEAFSTDVLEQSWREGGSGFELAWRNHQPVGYLQYRSRPLDGRLAEAPGLELERLYVLKRNHRMGVGRRLVEAAIREARNRKLNYLWLSVWTRNGQALEFYQHLGFEAAGDTTFLMGRHLQLDVLMRLDLDHTAPA